MSQCVNVEPKSYIYILLPVDVILAGLGLACATPSVHATAEWPVSISELCSPRPRHPSGTGTGMCIAESIPARTTGDPFPGGD